MSVLVYTIVVLISLVAIAPPSAAAPDEEAWGFAESLFREGDYYRAIGEYKRVMFLDSLRTGLGWKAALRIGDSYFAAGRYQDSATWSDRWLTRVPAPELQGRLSLLRAHSSFRLGRWAEAEEALDEYLRRGDTPEEADHAYYLLGLSCVRQVRLDGALSAFRLIHQDSPFADRARAYTERLRDAPPIPHRSPPAAAMLGLVPGLGYAYTGHYQTAAAALLVNALFLWGTVEAEEQDRSAATIILGTFGVGFYLGNIYGSHESAHRFNRYHAERFQEGFPE